MDTGAWKIEVNKNLPQKVATAVSELTEKLIGAQYNPILYIGSQLVNGVNHAVLAEQVVTTGRDHNNIVLLIFNEKGTNCELVSIERIIQSGEAFGGIRIADNFDLYPEHIEAFKKATEGFVGGRLELKANLASQITDTIKYFFAVEFIPATDGNNTFGIVVVNIKENSYKFVDVLLDRAEIVLGYAFTW